MSQTRIDACWGRIRLIDEEASARIRDMPLNDDHLESFASHHSADRDAADAFLARGQGLWNRAGAPVRSRVALRQAELVALQAERAQLAAEIRTLEMGVAQ